MFDIVMKPAFFDLLNNSPKRNILIIDKLGLIGEFLSLKLSEEFLVVFVSRRRIDLNKKHKNLIHVPFSQKFPVIPDGKYSQIIFIDEEGLDLELLPKVVQKAKDINAEFIFAQRLSPKGECAQDKVLRMYRSAKIVLFGDVFDNKLILRKSSFQSAINKFIYQAHKFGRIQVLGEGLREVHPVYLNDVAEGLIDLIFGIHKEHNLFYIFPKHAPTELSLAHMLQRVNPEIRVDFVKHSLELKNVSYPPGGKNLLGSSYPLAKKIRSIDINKKVKTEDEIPRESSGKFKNFPFFAVWIVIFLLFSPFIFTIFFSSLGLNTLYYANKEANRGNLASVKSSLRLSQSFFYLGKQTVKTLFFQAKIAGLEKKLTALSQDINFGYEISESLLQAADSGTYFSKVLNGKSENPTDDFIKGENYLKSSIVALDRIRAEEKIPVSILQSIDSITPLIKLISNTSDIRPGIFGIEEPRIYLILFQDNMELRPGGGAIDSYGILKLDKGKITEFSIHDTADADRELRGHVEPPFAVRRYLPEKHWYLKDSNFDVDFIKSASSSANFLLVETGEKADGVIGVDNSFIKGMLSALGSVYVKSYKQTINEDNFYTLMLSNAQEKDFSRSVYEAVITKLAEEKNSYFLVAQAVSDALLQKHLLLAFNGNTQNIFTANGWSSSLWDERRENKDSLNDFLGINEANLGTNGANYFIKRQILQKVTLQDNGNISEELTINYKNDNTTKLDGNYKNYLRIILPRNISLSEILINGKTQKIIDAIADPTIYEAENFKAPQGLEIEKTQEENKTIFGFLVEIPAGEIVRIKLKYTLKNETESNGFSYSLKLFKQPGVDSIPYSLSFFYPANLAPVGLSERMVEQDGKVSYSEKIVKDETLTVNLSPK